MHKLLEVITYEVLQGHITRAKHVRDLLSG